jgi:hypothetical protein
MIIIFLVIKETAALRISNNDFKSNPDSEKSKNVSGKIMKIKI